MKGKRTDLSGTKCPASRALGIVGDWWSLLIIRDALAGKTRFGEFQKSLGLAKNILSSRLKKLVESGVLRIEESEHAPSRPSYVLTDQGRRLAVVIVALWQWGQENCFETTETPPVLVERATGQPFARMEIRTADGRVVDPRDLHISLKGTDRLVSV